MSGIEVLDGGEGEPGGLDLLAEGGQLLDGPKLIGITGQSPAQIRAHRLILGMGVIASAEVIDQMSYDVRGPSLAGKGEVFRREHVPIETEAEFHHRR